MGKEFNVREITIRAWIDNFVKTNQAKAAAAAEAASTKPQSFKPTVVNPASQVRPAPAVIKLEKVQPQAQLVPKDNSEDVECIDIISDDDDESVTVGESAQSRSAELWQEQIRDLENKVQQSSNSEVEQLKLKVAELQNDMKIRDQNILKFQRSEAVLKKEKIDLEEKIPDMIVKFQKHMSDMELKEKQKIAEKNNELLKLREEFEKSSKAANENLAKFHQAEKIITSKVKDISMLRKEKSGFEAAKRKLSSDLELKEEEIKKLNTISKENTAKLQSELSKKHQQNLQEAISASKKLEKEIQELKKNDLIQKKSVQDVLKDKSKLERDAEHNKSKFAKLEKEVEESTLLYNKAMGDLASQKKIWSKDKNDVETLLKVRT